MSNHEVYFENHDRANRFPWSIYHAPLAKSLMQFLYKNNNNNHKKKLLVIGPGAFFEEAYIANLNYDVDVLDIDPRVLDNLQGRKISKFLHTKDGTLSIVEDQNYDLVIAKEVIEHIVNYKEYVKDLKRILKPDGFIWLSTPNYGFFLLPLLETTLLEAIARLNGYSRREIHPTKFSKSSLSQTVIDAGFKIEEIDVTPFGLALSCIIKK